METSRRQSKDIAQLLRLLVIEENLGDIKAGDLIFFAPTKMSMYSISGRIIEEPNRWRETGIPLGSQPKYNNTGMFLHTDAWNMRFLIGETVVEVDARDFGTLWTIRKHVR